MSRRPRPSARSTEVDSVEDEGVARGYELISNIREIVHAEVAELADELERQLNRGYRIVEIVASGCLADPACPERDDLLLQAKPAI